MLRPFEYLWLWVLLGLHVALGAGISFWLPARNDEAIGFMLGSVAAQSGVLAVVTAWFPWGIAVRVPIALAGLALSWFSVVASLWKSEPPGSIGGIAIVVGCMIGGQFAVTAALFWLARLLTRWRLSDLPDAPPPLPWASAAPAMHVEAKSLPLGEQSLDQKPSQAASPPAGDSQFRVLHLFFWMALVAVVLAVGRVLLPASVWGGNRLVGDIALIFILITTTNALLAIPLSLALLLPRLDQLLLATALVVVVWCPLVIGVQVAVFSMIRGRGDAEIFFVLDAAHALVLGLSLLLIRAQGYRLMQEGT